MKTLELFSGTASFSKVAKELGYDTFTVDINPKFNPDYVYDLTKPFDILLKDKLRNADIIWMSPPCTTFSMAAGNTHWTADRQPKTEQAKIGKLLLEVCKNLSNYCDYNGKIYFIENPRARARWFLSENDRKTVWYCQYGDTRAKPTDIWTNLKGWQPRQCHNGNKDCHHEPAPRGSKAGTQGLKGAKDRSVVPKELILELFTTLGGITLNPSNEGNIIAINQNQKTIG